LKDHKAVNAGEVADVLEVAAAHGGRDLFDQLRAAADATHDHRQRQAAINALGSFRDPAIAKDAIALLLTDEFDAREAYFALLFGPLDYPATRSLPFDFLKGHVDDLLKKLPREVGEDFAADLPRVGEAFCDATKRDEIEAFFKDRVKGYVGGPRTLEQTIEKIDVCIGERRAIEPEVDRFLMDAVAGAR
jgi:alanyl aminopeptidase